MRGAGGAPRLRPPSTAQSAVAPTPATSAVPAAPAAPRDARAAGPALIILDLMLPGLDGYRVLRALRADGLETPVLILSARGEETDKVLGFRLGADDYVTKPRHILTVRKAGYRLQR